MSNNSSISLQCQLLNACNCAYGISGTTYTPPIPYDNAVNWVGTPIAITGGSNDINAVLVGLASLNVNGTATNAIVVAFRGTLPPTSPFTWQEFQDWFQDFMATPVATKNIPGKVHSGFLAAVNSILPSIMGQIKALKKNYKNPPIYITGHSKGGGMASIFAALLAFQNPIVFQPTAVCTFASPMAGNAAFVSGFPTTIPVSRYENNLDVVPFLPPNDTVIDDLEKIPIIGSWFKQFEGWNYTPLGTLYFIYNGTVTQKATNTCWPLILLEMADGAIGGDGFANIAAAHHAACGGGYMGGTCPTGVCS